MRINKVKVVKAIVRLYFFGAIAASFAHIMTSAGKLGLDGWEQLATPFMIDGIAILGLIMRGDEWSKRTRKIGFRTQIAMGSVSLAANVHAAHSVGGVIFGIGIVALFVFAEWLSDNMQTIDVDKAAEAAAKKREAIEKGKATKARKARQAKRETALIAKMVNA